MSKKIYILIIIIFVVGLGGYLINRSVEVPQINSFEECVGAGYPVLESFPEQCKTPDGKTFVREIQITGEELVIENVLAFAAEENRVEESDVDIFSVVSREWPNSCLGLEREDEFCLQVIVPGFEVRVSIEGSEIVYRTNEDATIIRVEN